MALSRGFYFFMNFARLKCEHFSRSETRLVHYYSRGLLNMKYTSASPSFLFLRSTTSFTMIPRPVKATTMNSGNRANCSSALRLNSTEWKHFSEIYSEATYLHRWSNVLIKISRCFFSKLSSAKVPFCKVLLATLFRTIRKIILLTFVITLYFHFYIFSIKMVHLFYKNSKIIQRIVMSWLIVETLVIRFSFVIKIPLWWNYRYNHRNLKTINAHEHDSLLLQTFHF